MIIMKGTPPRSPEQIAKAFREMSQLAVVQGKDRPIDCYAGAAAALLWVDGESREEIWGDPPQAIGFTNYDRFLYAMHQLLTERAP